MKPPLFKYQIGLGVLGVFTFILTIFVLVQASGARQDQNTDREASKIATTLNSYVDKQQTIPSSLSEAGIKTVPKTITYKKTSDSTYKFCATYKSASNNLNATEAVTRATSAYYGYSGSLYNGSSSGGGSSLYISTVHKKGQTCQDIRPYLFNSSLYNSSSNSSSNSTTPYKTCDTEYNYTSSYLSVSSLTPKSGTTNATISVSGTPSATYQIDPKVKVFNYDCTPITLSDLAAGDYVSLYFNPYGSPVTMIVKEF